MLRRAPSVGSGYRWRGGGEAGACTESLGSDSGDVGCDAAEIDHFFSPPPDPPVPSAGGPHDADADAESDAAALCGAEEEAAAVPDQKRRRGGFPPAMARASGALVLRAERRGGRLILTEVRADEHERRVVFRAERHGGRLRLRFANDDDADAGEPDEAADGGSGTGGLVPVAAVQHTGGGGGELCQVAAAGPRGVEVGAI